MLPGKVTALCSRALACDKAGLWSKFPIAAGLPSAAKFFYAADRFLEEPLFNLTALAAIPASDYYNPTIVPTASSKKRDSSKLSANKISIH